MQSRLRLAGHGMQPLLLMFPLGLFWMAFVFDLATLLGAPTLIGTVAFWNIVAGLVGGLLTTIAAGIDAFSTTVPTAVRVFFLALLLDVGVLIVFAVLALMRVRVPDRAMSPGLLVLEIAGMLLAAFGAWFGGRFADPRAPVADHHPATRTADIWLPGTDHPDTRPGSSGAPVVGSDRAEPKTSEDIADTLVVTRRRGLTASQSAAREPPLPRSQAGLAGAVDET